jgi:hypothetical protein
LQAAHRPRRDTLENQRFSINPFGRSYFKRCPATSALVMSACDVFELSVWHSAGASLNVEGHSQTWFAIEGVG